MIIHCLQDTRKHQQKLYILVRGLPWIQKILPVVRRKRPVVMLAGTIHPCERLLVQQTFHPMLTRHSLKRLHYQMIVIDSHVRLRIDRRKLMLRWRHFIVLCLGCHAYFPQLLVHILHEARDPLTDRSEIMIVQLLPLRRHRAEQGAPRIDQVLPLLEFLSVHKKIFLLRTHRRRHLL